MSFFLRQRLLSVAHQREHVVVLHVILHGGEIHGLIRQHTIGLLPASPKARLLAVDVSLHFYSLLG